ncbi:hypothetical protein [Kitasatospora purpeofusca]|uniref:hypothetical protein n=1 Tax=Kitasatospora purpeofusca TaxID=67352 RepID=UPI0036798002
MPRSSGTAYAPTRWASSEQAPARTAARAGTTQGATRRRRRAACPSRSRATAYAIAARTATCPGVVCWGGDWALIRAGSRTGRASG